MTKNPDISIIGSGISGILLSKILEENNISYKLFDAKRNLKCQENVIGYVLRPYPIKILNNFGLKEDLLEKGWILNNVEIKNKENDTLFDLNLIDTSKRLNINPFMAIMKYQLNESLIKLINPSNLYLNHSLKQIENHDDITTCIFRNNKQYLSHYIIGADGKSSKVRSLIEKKVPKTEKPHVSAWLGTMDIPQKNKVMFAGYHIHTYVGFCFNLMRINKHQLSWFCTISSSKHLPANSVSELKSLLQKKILDKAPHLDEIIHNITPQNTANFKFYNQTPLFNWINHRTILVGDSAHSFTPEFGQGANQAIISTYQLGHYLNNKLSLKQIKNHLRTRYKKTKKINQHSRFISWYLHTKYPLIYKARNLIIKINFYLIPLPIRNYLNQKLNCF